VFVKTFELATDETNPQAKRRLETRILVRDSRGGVYGAEYKWRADNSDADLLTDSLTEEIPIRTKSGEVRPQAWYYPSRKDCLTCHTSLAGGVLGLKTRQLNRTVTFPSGVTDNELRAWNHVGLFSPAISEADIPKFARLAAASDNGRSLEDRARSYLDANCSQCHRPGGTVAYFDARFDTPLAEQGLVNGPVLIDEGIDHPRVIAPHDTWRSIAFMRVNTNDDVRMPPLARETIDQNGVALLREWIESLPGRAVLAPPGIAPAGGTFERTVEVALSATEPGAQIHYTLDGSEPGTSDAVYEKPLKLSADAVLRARAYKDGFTHSITAQQLFVIK
jgi:mono/diheme cytochrome c family protein